jgi:hypothetical protein
MITKDCKTCSPCEGCDPSKIVLPMEYAEDSIEPCDMCDPCSRWEKCAYCGNGFCRCDSIEETEDGPMHPDCAEKDRHWQGGQ